MHSIYEHKLGPYSVPYAILHKVGGCGARFEFKLWTDMTILDFLDNQKTIYRLPPERVAFFRFHQLPCGTTIEIYERPRITTTVAAEGSRLATEEEPIEVPPPPPPPSCSGPCEPGMIACPAGTTPTCSGDPETLSCIVEA